MGVAMESFKRRRVPWTVFQAAEVGFGDAGAGGEGGVEGRGLFGGGGDLSWEMIWRPASWRRNKARPRDLMDWDSWASICWASFLRDLIWVGDNLRGVFLTVIGVTMIVSFILDFVGGDRINGNTINLFVNHGKPPTGGG